MLKYICKKQVKKTATGLTACALFVLIENNEVVTNNLTVDNVFGKRLCEI
ncbi:hypothetical protein [Bacillus luti]|nr:hypothetical protein [Bacillus luti]